MPRHHKNPHYIEDLIRVPAKRSPAKKKQNSLQLRRCPRCRRLYPTTLPRCDFCHDVP